MTDDEPKTVPTPVADSEGEQPETGPSRDEGLRGTIEPEVLEKLPPEVRRVLELSMTSMQMHRFGPMPHPLTEKLNEGHVDKILEMSAKDDERTFEDVNSSRKYAFSYVVIGVALFIFVTVYLMSFDKAVYLELLKYGGFFLGGLGGGFGIKSYMDRNK